MKKKLLLAALIVPMALMGCATDEYKFYAESQVRIAEVNAKQRSDEAIANANRDEAMFKAMAATATGPGADPTTKVAALMGMAMLSRGQNNASSAPVVAQQISAPAPNQALAWASILVPGVTQLAGIAANMRVATVQSDNSTKVALSTNGTFAEMGRNTVDLGVAGLGSATTISGQGTAALTSVSGQGMQAITNVSNQGMSSIQAIAVANDAALSQMFSTNSAALAGLANKTNRVCSVTSAGVLTCSP